MATGWLKGTVKAVPSGDSLLIMGSVKGGPPPEKTITLAALIAPRLVSATLIVILLILMRFAAHLLNLLSSELTDWYAMLIVEKQLIKELIVGNFK